MFGWPTGVGCLLARRDALAKLERPWFSGGTIVAAFVQREWYQSAPGAAHFEDGTVNFLNLPAVEIGLRLLERIGIETIHTRVEALGAWLLDELGSLRHSRRLARRHDLRAARRRAPRRHDRLQLPPPGRPRRRRALRRPRRPPAQHLAAHRLLLQPRRRRGRLHDLARDARRRRVRRRDDARRLRRARSACPPAAPSAPRSASPRTSPTSSASPRSPPSSSTSPTCPTTCRPHRLLNPHPPLEGPIGALTASSPGDAAVPAFASSSPAPRSSVIWSQLGPRADLGVAFRYSPNPLVVRASGDSVVCDQAVEAAVFGFRGRSAPLSTDAQLRILLFARTRAWTCCSSTAQSVPNVGQESAGLRAPVWSSAFERLLYRGGDGLTALSVEAGTGSAGDSRCGLLRSGGWLL